MCDVVIRMLSGVLREVVMRVCCVRWLCEWCVRWYVRGYTSEDMREVVMREVVSGG